jgi:TRAP-type C4-dicarboxylate transport system permease small subunit
MREMVKGFAVRIRSLMRASTLLSMILLSIVVVIDVYDVLSGKIFDKPIAGVPEMTEMSMLFVCFLSIGYIAYRKREIEIDIFNPKLTPGAWWVLDRIRLSLCLFVLGLIVWQSIEQGLHVMEKGEVTANLQLPMFPFYFVITYGASLYCIEMLLQIYLGDEDGPPPEDAEAKAEF